MRGLSLARAAGDGVVEPQQHGGSHDRDEHTVEIEAGDAGRAERGEEIAAHHGADDSEYDIHQQPLAGAAHDLARDEARNQTQHNPGKNRHVTSPPLLASLTLYALAEKPL